MNSKLSVTLVALSMTTTVLLGMAAAIPSPPYFPNGTGLDPNSFGPRLNPTCAAEQLGFGGNAAGTSTDYHRYINDPAIGILDSCVNVGGAISCVTVAIPGRATADVTGGVAYILANQNPAGVQGGIDIALSGAGNLFQDDCGGLLGSGTDGEWDYGSAAALLNVRSGPGIEPGTSTSGGDGIDVCLDNAATAHHGADTTVYVEDVIMGGSIGFSVSADWARPAGLSDDGQDDNNFPGTRHCGDGGIEPCDPSGHAGWINEVVTYGSLPTVPPLPTSSANLVEALDVIQGCNPLDRTVHVDPCDCGRPVNSIDLPGATLADFGNGGAAGWLQVFLDTGSEANVCYDVAAGCPPADSADDVVVGGTVGVYDATSVSVPTAGWIWSGNGEDCCEDDDCCGDDGYTVEGIPWEPPVTQRCGADQPPALPAGTHGYYLHTAWINFTVGAGRVIVSETLDDSVKEAGAPAPTAAPTHQDTGARHDWVVHSNYGTCDWYEYTLTIVTECEATQQQETTVIKVRVVN